MNIKKFGRSFCRFSNKMLSIASILCLGVILGVKAPALVQKWKGTASTSNEVTYKMTEGRLYLSMPKSVGEAICSKSDGGISVMGFGNAADNTVDWPDVPYVGCWSDGHMLIFSRDGSKDPDGWNHVDESKLSDSTPIWVVCWRRANQTEEAGVTK